MSQVSVKPLRQAFEDLRRLYPGLDGAFWHGVPDRGAILDGVFLATKPPRFVWRRHFTFRDVPTP